MSEKETREEVINPQLEKAGWKGNLKKYIKEEVNSVKSNFKINEFVFKDANIERGVDRFIDYLLLADDNSPLAVIEAKKGFKYCFVYKINKKTSFYLVFLLDEKPMKLLNAYSTGQNIERRLFKKYLGDFSRR